MNYTGRIEAEVDGADNEDKLELLYDSDFVTVKLGGRELFSADWLTNLREVFLEALHRFPQEE